MGFKRYDGWQLHVPQQFIDNSLPICPFCRTDRPHWLLESRAEMSLAGYRTYYQCEVCKATLSSSAMDAAAGGGKQFAYNPFMAGLNAAQKGKKGQQVGVTYMKVVDIGSVCTDKSLLGQEQPITFFTDMISDTNGFAQPQNQQPQYQQPQYQQPQYQQPQYQQPQYQQPQYQQPQYQQPQYQQPQYQQPPMYDTPSRNASGQGGVDSISAGSGSKRVFAKFGTISMILGIVGLAAALIGYFMVFLPASLSNLRSFLETIAFLSSLPGFVFGLISAAHSKPKNKKAVLGIVFCSIVLFYITIILIPVIVRWFIRSF